MSVGVWLALAILIAANALYVAAEFAAVGVRRSRIQRLRDDGNWFAMRLAPHLADPAALDRYVGVSQIGITLSSLMLGAYAQATVSVALAPMLAGWFALTPVTAFSAAAGLVLVAMTAAQLVLGELVPKTLALQHPTETALATILPMQWSLVVFRPFITVLNGSALFILRLFGAADHSHHHLHSPEEIDLLIAESRDGGLLEPEEQQRLRRALHLGKRSARDLMVPRERLTMLNLVAPWEEVLQTVLSSPFSRIPIYRGAPDAIVGILRVKDLVERYAADGPVSLELLMRPVLQLDATLAADRVLTLLRNRRAHSAVVVDGHGHALGLVTIQDVLSELLGVTPDATARIAPAQETAP
jgi:CBS domain containing-hemolysin-like protein